MAQRTVFIAAHEDESSSAERLRTALCEQWQGGTGVRTIPIDPTPSPKELRRAGAVIANAAAQPMHQVLALLEAAESAGVPALVLVNDDRTLGSASLASALVLPSSTPAVIIGGALEGLIHAGAEVRRLKTDLSLAHRASGGLEGEIVKMHEELQLAAMVQRELLPRELPEVHGVSFGSLWRPANYVSGDIYDVNRLDEDHVGIFLADSVGHGVPAALMTMVISRSLTMKDIEGDAYRILAPSEVLGRLNAELLLRQGRTTRFATAVCAIVNCRDRTVQIASAGHPAPLLIRGQGELAEVESLSGGLLGIFEGEEYEQVELELEMDDRLLFYSDGFEQAFPAKTSDAYQRMLPTVHYRSEFQEIAQQKTPSLLIEQLRIRLDQQTGSLHQIDDLTLICMYAGPIGARKAASPACVRQLA